MKKLRKNFLVSLLLTLALSVTSVVPVSAEIVDTSTNEEIETASLIPTTLATVGVYEDKYFTDMSEPEPVHIHIAADSISLAAECMDDTQSEDLICCIEPLDSNNPFGLTLPFVANGSVTTYPISVPVGRYKVYFIGNENGNEIYVADAVFSAYIN